MPVVRAWFVAGPVADGIAADRQDPGRGPSTVDTEQARGWFTSCVRVNEGWITLVRAQPAPRTPDDQGVTADVTTRTAPECGALVARLEAELAETRLELEDARVGRREAEARARTAEAAVLAVRAVVTAVC